MRTVLPKAGQKRIILQTGKTICAHFSRRSSNEFQLPPEPTTCCMSGCTNCVWIEYAETIAKLMDGNNDKACQIILDKIKDPNLKMFLAVELKALQYNVEKNTNSETEKTNSK